MIYRRSLPNPAADAPGSNGYYKFNPEKQDDGTRAAIDTSPRLPRLRIVHIITKGAPMGGAQFNTLYSLRYQQQNHDVAAIVGSDGPLAQACAQLGIPCYVVPFENRLLSPIGDIRAIIAMRRLLRGLRPDLVHTHSSKAGVLGRVAARLARTPAVVHTLHVLPYHDRQPRMLQALLAGIERACAPLTDEIVSVADTLAVDFVARGVCSRDRIHTVVSGIDFAEFPADPRATRANVRRDLGIEDDELVIISVANLEPRKRLDVLVEAMARLRAGGIAARLVLVGAGEMDASLRAQVQVAKIEDDVLFLGKRDDVPNLLAASDVFVQTSQLEGLSRSLVEALYSGLVVIATDVNATREIVRNDETGWLIPPADVEALTRRLYSVISQPVTARLLGGRAHQEIGESRSIDVMGRQLEDVYRAALAHAGVKVASVAEIGSKT